MSDLDTTIAVLHSGVQWLALIMAFSAGAMVSHVLHLSSRKKPGA